MVSLPATAASELDVDVAPVRGGSPDPPNPGCWREGGRGVGVEGWRVQALGLVAGGR